MQHPIAVIGSGPAGLMAASLLADAGCRVTVFEKNKGPGHKLLIAGGSGLNISNALPPGELVAHYAGDGIGWIDLFEKFSVADWLAFIQKLGLETFEGTSGRFFVREMKASGLLRRWLSQLESKQVNFHYARECVGVASQGGVITLTFANGESGSFAAALFALGGGSWLKESAAWPGIFTQHGIGFAPFQPANSGFEVAWSAGLLSEAADQPLKNIEFSSSAGKKKGDLMITRYGIEGTPVYFCGRAETCRVDLKPAMTEKEIVDRLYASRENLSPLRRAQRLLNLGKTALALVYHEAPKQAMETIEALSSLIKNFPLKLLQPRPLSEAISSTGGIRLNEIDGHFMLKKLPGVFVAGEMLDWHAPTGGFLIQACVSQGYAAAQGVLRHVRERTGAG